MSFPDEDFETVLRESLGIPASWAIVFDAPLADYGLDSLGAVNLVVDLEQRFGVTFPDGLLVRSTFHSAETLWRALSELRVHG
ncbi:acyl carrier protein [Bailinhaonella thermotolerans]|uniref:acyl carrier protein n=1 Tax=Bailinhaonella thermotolerans TaxID=1070861 RepID=UPI00192A254F|nr:acyl carrier protein [Bailinhaonella thermotolerans]